MPPIVGLDRNTIAQDLRTYGEDELADRVASITEGQRIQIGWAAGRHWEGPETGPSMQLRKAVAMAAVEVLEGASRSLKRQRARSST